MTSPFSLQKISWNTLQLGDLIGQGGYGNVYQGHWQGKEVAIKELLLKKLPEQLLKDFENETQVMAQCRCAQIVSLLAVCVEPGHYAMVMDYMSKGSLYNVLHDTKEELPWNPLRFRIAIDIFKGLAYLHAEKILHRDLKSLNVLLDQDYHAKITDFGLAKIKLETSSTSTLNQKSLGTVRWLSPELFNRSAKPTTASDIYAAGMVLWELSSRKLPFSDAANEQIVVTWISTGEQEEISADCPEKVGQVIKCCWAADPLTRPSAQEASIELDQALPAKEKKTKKKKQSFHTQGSLKKLKTKKGADHPTSVIQAEAYNSAASASYKPAAPKSVVVPPKIEPLKPMAPKSVSTIAFGKTQWERFFGDVGVEPPLPIDIDEILSSPCPFWYGKKVFETHLLVLIPKTVNNKPLTLNNIGELIQNLKLEKVTQFESYYNQVTKHYGIKSINESHWVLMTHDVIPGSRNQSYEDQEALITKKGKGYSTPKLLDATVSILMTSFVKRLYISTFTRCQESIDNLQCMLGTTSSNKLIMCFDDLDSALYIVNNDTIGVGAIRKF